VISSPEPEIKTEEHRGKNNTLSGPRRRIEIDPPELPTSLESYAPNAAVKTECSFELNDLDSKIESDAGREVNEQILIESTVPIDPNPLVISLSGSDSPTPLAIEDEPGLRRRMKKFVSSRYGLLFPPNVIKGRQPGTGRAMHVHLDNGPAYDCSFCRQIGYIVRFREQAAVFRHCMADCPNNLNPEKYLQYFKWQFHCEPRFYKPYSRRPGEIESWYCRFCEENAVSSKEWSTVGWAKRHWLQCQFNPRRVDKPPPQAPDKNDCPRGMHKKKRKSGKGKKVCLILGNSADCVEKQEG
jgi:hypothetical protein